MTMGVNGVVSDGVVPTLRARGFIVDTMITGMSGLPGERDIMEPS